MTTVFGVNLPWSLVGSDSSVDEGRNLMWYWKAVLPPSWSSSPRRLFYPKDGGSKSLQNVGNHFLVDTV
jgi:hypothetical protein